MHSKGANYVTCTCIAPSWGTNARTHTYPHTRIHSKGADYVTCTCKAPSWGGPENITITLLVNKVEAGTARFMYYNVGYVCVYVCMYACMYVCVFV